MAIKVSDYWPQPKPGEKIRFDYYTKTNALFVSSVFSLDAATNSVLYEDYGGQWLNAWFLNYSNTRGVVEWRDDASLSGILKLLFGARSRTVYKVGKEILWGNQQQVGDKISNQIEIDYSKSYGLFPPFKGSWSFGWQEVAFNNLYPTYKTVLGDVWNNVLEFTYMQKWSKWAGAIYRCAKGVGPIEIQWIAVDSQGNFVISDPIAAKVSTQGIA